ETVRAASLTKKGEFKLVRMAQGKREEFTPDVLGIMESKLSRNREGLKKYTQAKKNGAECEIFDANTVNGIPGFLMACKDIDIVITSPPYGDSRTTVAYGQFSRLANQWLGIEDANQVDKIAMGGQKAKGYVKFGVGELDKAIGRIMREDEKRALDVVSFYEDYRESVRNAAKVVRRKGIAAYVVGNRRVKGIELPTDAATRRFFEGSGYNHLKTIIRSIPNKRMPSRNSPTNESGVTGVTMHNEYIVVMQKN
ncbi:MAG: DNA methyltransferase, partial [Deltaproteobacteria bacterium]|nr:DNA methyltransferase [Deltaproteobacteria bacterium]